MKSLMKKVREFVKNEEGQGMVEYALILALIAVVVIIVLTYLGLRTQNAINNVQAAMNT